MNERATRGDVIAGVTNALVYVPQGIGYAIVVGVSPIYGLYTGVLPPILGALTTASIYMQVTATNELAIPAGRIAREMGGAFTADKLFTMTLLVGLFALVAGLLRMGRIVRFISNSVMTGFVLGIMVMLILGQIVQLTGYSGAVSGNDLWRMFQVLTHPHAMHTPTVLVGVATIIATALLLRTRLRQLAYVITLLGVSIAIELFAPDGVVLAGEKHPIASGFPLPVMPDLNAIPELLLPSLTLVIVGLSFGAGVAQSYPARDGKVGNPSRDFFGQGVANAVSSFFQCMPSGGSMSRTAYVVETGAKTRWANVFTGLTMLAIVLTVADWAARVPLIVVAGLLMVLGWTAIDFQRLAIVWRINRTERMTMLVTAILTVVVSPPLAILVGVILSFMMFVHASASSIVVMHLVRQGDGLFVERPLSETFPANAVTVLRMHGYLFFADIGTIEHRLAPFLRVDHAALVLSFRGYTSVGSTGILFLERFAQQMAQVGNRLVLADVCDEIRQEFERTAILDKLGDKNVVAALTDPQESIARAFAVASEPI